MKIVGSCGILKVKGGFESASQCTCSHKLLTFDGLSPHIDLEYGIWEEDVTGMTKTAKSFSDIKNIKSLSIDAEAGDVVSLHLVATDGTDIRLPIRSLKVELAELPQKG